MEKEYRYKGYVFRREYAREGDTIEKYWEILLETTRKNKCFYSEEYRTLIKTNSYESTLNDCWKWVNERLDSLGVNHKNKRRKPEPDISGCMPGRRCYFCGYGQLFHKDKIKLEAK